MTVIIMDFIDYIGRGRLTIINDKLRLLNPKSIGKNNKGSVHVANKIRHKKKRMFCAFMRLCMKA